MRVVTFKIEDELLEALDDYARRSGETRSEVIRKALRILVSRDYDRKRKIKVRVLV